MPSKSSGSKHYRCQHKSSALCPSCQQEKNELQGIGTWPSDPNPTRVPYNTFVQQNPALHPSPKSTTQTQARTQQQSKKPTQQPASTTKPSNERHDKNTPSLQNQPRCTTATSSVATTHGSSPITNRTTAPAYVPRQALPAVTNTGVVARGHPHAMVPREVSQLRTHFEQMHIAAGNKFKESETDSDGESESSSGDDDDE